jgi:hypothetical protein
MIAKKPKPTLVPKVSESKARKFEKAAKHSSNGAAKANGGEPVPVLLKFPPDLLEWLSAKAADRHSPRTSYILGVLLDHRAAVEKAE